MKSKSLSSTAHLSGTAKPRFGEALVRHVLPEVLGKQDSGMLARASITRQGRLTAPYAYLKNYLEGRS